MDQPTISARRSLKRKLEQEFHEDRDDRKFPATETEAEADKTCQDLARDIQAQVDILNSSIASLEADRTAAKRAVHFLSQLAKNGNIPPSLYISVYAMYFVSELSADVCIRNAL